MYCNFWVNCHLLIDIGNSEKTLFQKRPELKIWTIDLYFLFSIEDRFKLLCYRCSYIWEITKCVNEWSMQLKVSSNPCKCDTIDQKVLYFIPNILSFPFPMALMSEKKLKGALSKFYLIISNLNFSSLNHPHAICDSCETRAKRQNHVQVRKLVKRELNHTIKTCLPLNLIQM